VRRSFVVALAAALLLAACGRVPVPVHLAGLHRVRVWTGAGAARMVAGLHGAAVAPRDSTVADYGAPGQLRIWISRYPDEVHAMEVLARMVEGMRTGRSPFATPQQLQGPPGRWLTVGPGGHNVLWTSGPTVYWLQGEPDAVLRAADELPPPTRGQLA
jgi:hypothetical protein